MFCSKCGKNLADGVQFCDACGTPTGAVQAPVQQVPVQQVPVANPYAYTAPRPAAQPNPAVTNFVKALLGFFTKDPTQTVLNATKSTTLEWLLVAGVNLFVYIFAFALNMVTEPLGKGELFTFGEGVLDGLLFGAGSYFLMSVALYLGVKAVYRKNVNIQSVFNMVAIASLPLTCVYLLNIALGFIWLPFVLMFSFVGFVATAVLMYEGFKALGDGEGSPLIAYLVSWLAVTVIVMVVAYFIANGQSNDMLKFLF